jgi:hypothetical protein
MRNLLPIHFFSAFFWFMLAAALSVPSLGTDRNRYSSVAKESAPSQLYPMMGCAPLDLLRRPERRTPCPWKNIIKGSQPALGQRVGVRDPGGLQSVERPAGALSDAIQMQAAHLICVNTGLWQGHRCLVANPLFAEKVNSGLGRARERPRFAGPGDRRPGCVVATSVQNSPPRTFRFPSS